MHEMFGIYIEFLSVMPTLFYTWHNYSIMDKVTNYDNWGCTMHLHTVLVTGLSIGLLISYFLTCYIRHQGNGKHPEHDDDYYPANRKALHYFYGLITMNSLCLLLSTFYLIGTIYKATNL
jgi:hypothetical protein